MKGRQVWAYEWMEKYSSPGEFEEFGQQEAWMAGFILARQKAADFLRGFNHTEQLSILVNAIGEGQVDIPHAQSEGAE